MRVSGVYLLLLVGAAIAGAEEAPPVALTCEVEAPRVPGGLVLMSVKLTLEDQDSRSWARVNVGADGQGTAVVRRGRQYRVRPFGIVVMVGRRVYSVSREEIAIEPEEISIPISGPLPEPRLRLRLRRGRHRLRLRVATRSGRAIPGARIRVERVLASTSASVPCGVFESDMRGEMQVTNLPAGRYRVALIDSGPFGVRKQRTIRRRRYRIDEVVVGSRDQREAGFVVEAAGVLHVTVDTRGMKEAPPVAVWTMFARLVAGPKARPDAPGPGAEYRFTSLPPGRYRVVATLPDGSTRFREAEIHAGAVTPILLARSVGRQHAFEFHALWEKMPPDLHRTRWYLTALGAAGLPTSVYEAVRGRALRRTYGPEPRRGRYLLRYPAQGLARLLDLDESNAWGVDFTPPPIGFLRRGHRRITVRVLRGGKPVTDLFVGLQERARTGAASEKWMRYAATTAGGAVFAEVPAGWYRLRFLDSVLGKRVGKTPRPRALSVWRDDVDLTIDLNE